jgi:2-succinyl-6-hydroxy-2,4-cyclohexadiene-1-carboxylate synthase
MYQIHALHGFLGRPTDWEICKPLESPHVSFLAHDLFKDLPIQPFSLWTKAFNPYILSFDKPGQHPVMMGYSLGGRLGLQALLQAPNQWKAAIFISTHPGLTAEQEKKARYQADKLWAKRFEREAWKTLMTDWNDQEVFKGQHGQLERKEADFNRTHLTEALRTWSLGKQENDVTAISRLNIPILWMVGERDLKFVQLANSLTFKHPLSKVLVVPNAFHRLPWQQTQYFLTGVSQFFHNLESTAL